MSMKVIPPLEITSALLTSSTVSEPDATVGEVAWNAATNYSIGDYVVRTTTHRVYKNLIAGVDATAPESAPTRWLDYGPTNKYAMFDFDQNSATVGASPLVVVITPGVRIGGIGIFGAVADSVQVVGTVLGVPFYAKTTNLLARNSTAWSEYFFGVFRYRSVAAFLDIPQYSNAVFTVTFTRASGNAECGALVIGVPVEVGNTQYGAENDIINFSTYDRDTFGNATLVKRKVVPRTTKTVWMDAYGVDKARKLREDLASAPAAWFGMDDDSSPFFQSMAVLGIFRRFTIQLPGPRHSLCTIELEGL